MALWRMSLVLNVAGTNPTFSNYKGIICIYMYTLSENFIM